MGLFPRIIVSRSLSLIKQIKTIWPRHQTLPPNPIHGQGSIIVNSLIKYARYSSAASTPPPVYHLKCLPFSKPIIKEDIIEEYKELTTEEYFATWPDPPPPTKEAIRYRNLKSLSPHLSGYPFPVKDIKDPTFYPFIKECAAFALRDYTRRTGHDDIYEFVEIDKVNCVIVNGHLFYVTFKATTPQKEEFITFQATLYQYEDKLEVHHVDIKTPGTDDGYDGKFSVPDVD